MQMSTKMIKCLPDIYIYATTLYRELSTNLKVEAWMQVILPSSVQFNYIFYTGMSTVYKDIAIYSVMHLLALLWTII